MYIYLFKAYLLTDRRMVYPENIVPVANTTKAFMILQHFETKLCALTNFNTLFSARVINFVLPPWIKNGQRLQLSIQHFYLYHIYDPTG